MSALHAGRCPSAEIVAVGFHAAMRAGVKFVEAQQARASPLHLLTIVFVNIVREAVAMRAQNGGGPFRPAVFSGGCVSSINPHRLPALHQGQGP